MINTIEGQGTTISRRGLIKGAAAFAAAGALSELGLATQVTAQESQEVSEDATLRELADQKGIRIASQVSSESLGDPLFTNVLTKQFNTVALNGQFTWTNLTGEDGVPNDPNSYSYTHADRVSGFAEKNDMQMDAYPMIWGNPQKLPNWLLNLQVDPLQAMETHLGKVVSDYEGKFQNLFVVNEPFGDWGGFKLDPYNEWSFWNLNTPWTLDDGSPTSVGDPNGLPLYLEKAYAVAHEADPEAKLFLNEYNADVINDKSNTLYAVVQRLQARGVPLHGVGLQMHLRAISTQTQESIDALAESFRANLERLKGLGLEVAVTEMDVSLEKLDLPKDEMQAIQAEIFRGVFRAYTESGAGNTFTIFGATDKNHIDNWTGKPNTDPTLFGDNYQKKPAYDAIKEEMAKLPDISYLSAPADSSE